MAKFIFKTVLIFVLLMIIGYLIACFINLDFTSILTNSVNAVSGRAVIITVSIILSVVYLCCTYDED